MEYPTISDTIGNTPLVRLKNRQFPNGNMVLLKLESRNPGGSIKDRAVKNMLERAMERGDIKAGDKLVEPTSGNTGIALAMLCAANELDLTLVMPRAMSIERRKLAMSYGASLMLAETLDDCIETAQRMKEEGYKCLNQFSNEDNAEAHVRSTAPEIVTQTAGRVTHVISMMGSTGTAMGIARYMGLHMPHVKVVGVEPEEATPIQGTRNWPTGSEPSIYDGDRLAELVQIDAGDALDGMRDLAAMEGVLVGQSSGAAFVAAMQVAYRPDVHGATIVAIMPDCGERYMSMEGWWEPNAKSTIEI